MLVNKNLNKKKNVKPTFLLFGKDISLNNKNKDENIKSYAETYIKTTEYT